MSVGVGRKVMGFGFQSGNREVYILPCRVIVFRGGVRNLFYSSEMVTFNRGSLLGLFNARHIPRQFTSVPSCPIESCVEYGLLLCAYLT